MAIVKQLGKVLVVRIPERLAKQLQIQAGSTVKLRVDDGALVLQRRRRRRYRLADLLRNTKPNQLRGENEF